MECPRCGFEQHIGATFCPNCGWLLASGENPDDFWRIDNPPSAAVKRRAKRRRRKTSKADDDRTSLASHAQKSPEWPSGEVSPQPRTEEPTDLSQPSVSGSTGMAPEPKVKKAQPQVPPSPDATLIHPVVQGSKSEDEESKEWPASSEVHPSARPDQLSFYTTPQAPAIPRPAGFTIRPASRLEISHFLWPAAALLVGILLGASLMYIFSPQKEYIVLDPLPTPAAQPDSRPIGGIVAVPVPRTSPGPIPVSGPDLSAQNDLRNASIAQKQHYAKTGQYTAELEVLQKEAPHVVWEPGVTPSRPGVVAVMVCGGTDATSPVLLQAQGVTGKYYAIYDVPSGPAAGLYYGMSQQAFSCPNSSPPQLPWMPSIQGWGGQQPRVQEELSQASPQPSPPTDEEILGGYFATPAPTPITPRPTP